MDARSHEPGSAGAVRLVMSYGAAAELLARPEIQVAHLGV